MMGFETTKKCNSSTLIVCLVLFLLFMASKIKVSSISNKLQAAMSTWADQETTVPVPKDPSSHIDGQTALDGPIICNRSHLGYDICSMKGPTILDSKLFTLYIRGPTAQVQKIKPYPRKWDFSKMSRIKEVTLTSRSPSPPCKVQHNIPALVFSVGGYSGNFYTDFADELIPLFITIDSIFSGKDLVLVISNVHDWWISRYADLLRSFSKHPIINLDTDATTHCFPSATIGLISLGVMSADPKPTPNSKTILRFHELLEKTYGHNHPASLKSRPQLVLLGRSGYIGRSIMNRAAVKRVAEEEGFHVVEFDPKYAITMRESYELLSSSHVMVGVHGAALTHFLFLRPGSVFIQVVPLGTQWLAEECFGNFAEEMGLDYMEYNVGVDESSLVDKYGKDDMLVKYPEAFQKKKGGWSSETVEIYLYNQNVRLNLNRFRGYLKKVFVKAKAFMDKED